MVCQTLPEKKIPEKYSRTKPHYLYLYQLDHVNTIPESHQQAFTNCVHGYDRAPNVHANGVTRTRKQSPSMEPTLSRWRGLLLRGVHPSASTGRSRRSDATSFDKN